MPEGYIHLTPDDRCQIEVLLKRGDSRRAIARLLERPACTIRREMACNAGQRGYRKKQAQIKCCGRRATASRCPKRMTPEVIAVIEGRLVQAQWSPQQISGWMQQHASGPAACVSHERIYQHVWRDKRQGGTLWKHLRHNGKKYNKRKGLTAGRGCIPDRIDNDQRQAIVDRKARRGARAVE